MSKQGVRVCAEKHVPTFSGEVIDIITKTTTMVHQLTGVNIGAQKAPTFVSAATPSQLKTSQAAM